MERPITKISVTLGATLNIKDKYNNVKWSFTVDDWVRPSDDSTEAALDRVYDLLDKKIEEKVKEYEDDK